MRRYLLAAVSVLVVSNSLAASGVVVVRER